jgi:hypothetical protein
MTPNNKGLVAKVAADLPTCTVFGSIIMNVPIQPSSRSETYHVLTDATAAFSGARISLADAFRFPG